jgi:putative intracellular protease/amidase
MKATRTVYLYTFDTMADWEYGYLAAELNTGRFFAEGKRRLELKTLALDLTPKVTMGGLRILPDLSLGELKAEDCALLILPGGDTWLDPMHAPAIQKVRSFLDAGIPVAAICAATIALAAAGILDDRAHTSNDLGYLKAVCPSYRGEANFLQEPAVVDRGLITASGIAPVEFTHIVLQTLGLLSEGALEGWLGLYRSHEPKYYFQLMAALPKMEVPA